jgi:hypothetical protein
MKQLLGIPALYRAIALAAIALLTLAGVSAGHAGAVSVGPTSQLATTVSDDIATDTTWTPAGSPYVVAGPISVLSTATLTVEAGVEVRFRPAAGLRVLGGLNAQGDHARQIQMLADDGVSWQGLTAAPTGVITLVSVTLKNAAVGVALAPASALVPAARSGRVDVLDSLLTLNGTGVSADFASSARLTLRNNLVYRNGTGVLLTGQPKGNAKAKLNHNSFVQNGIAMKAVGASGKGIKAQQQWWGSAAGAAIGSAPLCASTPLPGASTANVVCGNVDFTPWAKVPSGRVILGPGQGATIESAAGQFALSDDDTHATSVVTLTVPAGAFDQQVDLLVAPLAPPASAPPGRPTLLTLEVSASANGQLVHQFAGGKQLQFEIAYIDQDLNGADPARLKLYFLDEATGAWSFSGYTSVADPQRHRLAANLSHLTRMRVTSADLPSVLLPMVRK